MNKVIRLLSAILFVTVTTHAQSFSSGSTGADGALNLSTMNCPNNVCEVQLPDSGVLNYTTVNISGGKTLRFRKNLRNTPVTLLAQGDVNITGVIDVSAVVPAPCNPNGPPPPYGPGPGGFYGGNPGGVGNPGEPGFGPGGGQNNGEAGRWVGPLSLVPIVGGSGSAGLGLTVYGGMTGGPGGGAIMIASSTSILMTGQVYANGGLFANCNISGGPGSGGAIRLVANSVNASGSFSALSGTFTACGGGCGVVRLEAPSGALTFTGSSNPPAGLFPINPALGLSALPVLRIVSIGGFPVPSYAGSRFDTYDMLLPNQLPDPISVDLQGTNLPPGTQVTVGFVNHPGSPTSTPGTLTGTLQFSTATATISGLNRSAVTYLLATAIFDPPIGAMNFNPKGSNHVAKVRIVASPGAKPKFVFLRSNGTEVDVAKLSKRFLEQLGL